MKFFGLATLGAAVVALVAAVGRPKPDESGAEDVRMSKPVQQSAVSDWPVLALAPTPRGPSSERRKQYVFAIPGTVAVHFPDGDYVSVTFRRVPPLREVSNAIAATMVSAWPRVGSDHDAAFARYRFAHRCYSVLSTLGTDPHAANADCQGDIEYYARERNGWLRAAADAGNVHAIRIAAMSESYAEDTADMLRKAWKAGYIPPLGRLADRYFRETDDTDQHPSSRVLGLAHLWLQAHLQDAAAGEGRRSYVAELYDNLDARMAEATAAEIQAALVLAKEMLKRNDHCCFGP